MADLRASGLGGVPKGATADRPSSPSIGDVFYNGTLGCLEIYTTDGWYAASAPMAIPTIGTATALNSNRAYSATGGVATVAFSQNSGGGLPNTFTATSNPGSITGTDSSSPITITGLTPGTSYTFSVVGTNNFGTSAATASSNSITVSTVPQSPTIGTASTIVGSGTSISLAFTAGANGGSSITNYKYSTDGTTYTALSPAQTTSPLTISGLTIDTPYTFYIKAVNANGDSIASSVSNSVTPTLPAVTGGTLYSDATYHYRAFTSTSNLVLSGGSVSMDVLTIAGGGAGGGAVTGGGGGAGGVFALAAQSITPGTYNCLIGGGGTGVALSSVKGGSGTASQFGSYTPAAVGGGGGGSNDGPVCPGADGGSGGGAAGTGSGVAYPGGSPTSGQGYAGGLHSSQAPAYGSGGGGGAGGAGGNGTNSNGGVGGSSVNTYLNATWIGAAVTASSSALGVSGYFAGGGGGGVYGSGTPGNGGGGGAGNGAVSNAGVDATNNTGSGGGGAGQGGGQKGGNGGSGLIIVRYLKSVVK